MLGAQKLPAHIKRLCNDILIVKMNKFILSKRKHICLITYHGYPGANIPIGGTPDTGGQIIYVNSYAKALDQLGYKVSIFTRGGFPFFNQKKMRKGIECLSEYSRYVYVPSGPDFFIPKEDIGYILDEAVDWVYDFINKEAKQKKTKSYNYFWFVNSHYWDAGVIGYKLIRRWQNDVFMEQLKKLKFKKDVISDIYPERHKLNLSNNINYFTGEMFFNHLQKTCSVQLPDNIEILNYKAEIIEGLNKLTGETQAGIGKLLNKAIQESKKLIKPAVFSFLLEKLGRHILEKKLPDIKDDLKKINKHIWTPHSIGALKERNYWNKDNKAKRKLKFLERTNNERIIVQNTPVIAATSAEIISICRNYYNVPLKNIVYFPPGSDDDIFKPRTKKECKKARRYLSKITRIKETDLINKRIIFETSRMDTTKRKDLLINAFKLIADKYEDVLLLIGGGPDNQYSSSLKNLIKKNRLEKKAFVTGFIPDDLIGEFFSIATIFVSASEMEGFGISVLNAISSRTPIVTSDLIPISVQYLKSCSIIVPAGNVNGFARGIKKYLDDERLLKQYGEMTYEISHDFKWINLTRNLIQDLKGLKIV